MWTNFFQAGGWGMYPTLVFGCFALLYSTRFSLSIERQLAGRALAFGGLTLVAGSLGTITGLIKTFRYIQQVSEPERVLIACLGTAESLNNIFLATLILFFSLSFGTIGIVRRDRRAVAVEA